MQVGIEFSSLLQPAVPRLVLSSHSFATPISNPISSSSRRHCSILPLFLSLVFTSKSQISSASSSNTTISCSNLRKTTSSEKNSCSQFEFRKNHRRRICVYIPTQKTRASSLELFKKAMMAEDLGVEAKEAAVREVAKLLPLPELLLSISSIKADYISRQQVSDPFHSVFFCFSFFIRIFFSYSIYVIMLSLGFCNNIYNY